MNLDNFLVRRHRQQVETWRDREKWEHLTTEDSNEILEHLAGLPSPVNDPDPDAMRFDMLVLRLQLAQLEGDAGTAERIRETVQAIAAALLPKEPFPQLQSTWSRWTVSPEMNGGLT